MSVNLLNYPIYKKQIQDGSIQKELNEKIRDEEINKFIQLQVEKIISNIITKHHSGKKYQYEYKSNVNFYSAFNVYSEKFEDMLKDKILNSLKEKLPDCDIQMDPLKTYILIDWS